MKNKICTLSGKCSCVITTVKPLCFQIYIYRITFCFFSKKHLFPVFLLQTVRYNHHLSERKPNKPEACILLFLSCYLRLYTFYYIHIINLSNLHTFAVFYDIYVNCKRRVETIFFDSPPVMGLLSSSNPPHTSK